MTAFPFTLTNVLEYAAGDDYTNSVCHIGTQIGVQAAPTTFQPTKHSCQDHFAATELVIEFPFFRVIDIGVWFSAKAGVGM